jgi:hypothetical protein
MVMNFIKKNKKILSTIFLSIVLFLLFAGYFNAVHAQEKNTNFSADSSIAKVNKDGSDVNLNTIEQKIFLGLAWIAYAIVYFIGLVNFLNGDEFY